MAGALLTVLAFAFRERDEVEISADVDFPVPSGSSRGAPLYEHRSSDRRIGRRAAAAAKGVLASRRVVVAYGFWIFLLSDIVMFAALFAAYAVLVGATAGGPSGEELFSQRNVAIETACLLASSYTCGLMSFAIASRRPARHLHRRDRHVCARCRFPRPGDARVRRDDRAGRYASEQRVSIGVFHARRLPRRARLRRAVLAGCHDGPGRGERLAAERSSGGSCAFHCSGTRSTSSGSRCSPWSI